MTVALVIVFGAGPLELSGGARRAPEAAAAVARGEHRRRRRHDHDVEHDDDHHDRAPDHHHDRAADDHDPLPPLRVPGLDLPKQPAPQPVSLPPTGSAPVFNRIPTTNKVIFLGIDDGLVKDPPSPIC